jgi:hypothetical protein
MLHREIIAVCSKIHTERINTLCGQKVEFWMLNMVVQKVTLKNWRKYELITEAVLTPILDSGNITNFGPIAYLRADSGGRAV